MTIFEDRVDAGRELGRRLAELRGQDIVVLGLPRGGVPVAFEVAAALDAPLDVIVVRKLGLPDQPELAMGAIGEGGAACWKNTCWPMPGSVTPSCRPSKMNAPCWRTVWPASGRAGPGRTSPGASPSLSTTGSPPVPPPGSPAGSPGSSAPRGSSWPSRSPPPTPSSLTEPDEVVCLATPHQFSAVGYHYRDFSPTDDDEVVQLLDAAAKRLQNSQPASRTPLGRRAGRRGAREEVEIPSRGVRLQGQLHLPVPARGVVLFAHGSGSSRHSPRNRYVAAVLQQAGLGTLLLDLLTPAEERNRANVFDIELLARRLSAATDWLAPGRTRPPARSATSGPAPAPGRPSGPPPNPTARIDAVVSRGGRPDLAGPRLSAVRAPTLLIVGSYDHEVLELNRKAKSMMRCPNQLAVVQGATHLFEEPGTLAAAAILARDWFVDYLLPAKTTPGATA